MSFTANSPPRPAVVLFCKTYAGDSQRTKRLLSSISAHNKDSIPVVVSVPTQDFSKFEDDDLLKKAGAELISDESIISCGNTSGFSCYASWDGRLSQQVIKSEFWRYWLATHKDSEELIYICIDSESEFIRDFFLSDFINSSGAPYTICHDHRDLLTIARQKRVKKVEVNFRKDCALMKEVFSRSGPDYAFSPTPVIWSSRVWQDLDNQYLLPQKITIWDAIKKRPNELHWYGESLLHFRSIPLIPKSPLFRVYHYDWEFFSRKKSGETIETLKKQFLGIHKQSNWDRDSDNREQEKKRSLLSNLRYRIRRWYLEHFI